MSIANEAFLESAEGAFVANANRSARLESAVNDPVPPGSTQGTFTIELLNPTDILTCLTGETFGPGYTGCRTLTDWGGPPTTNSAPFGPPLYPARFTFDSGAVVVVPASTQFDTAQHIGLDFLIVCDGVGAVFGADGYLAIFPPGVPLRYRFYGAVLGPLGTGGVVDYIGPGTIP